MLDCLPGSTCEDTQITDFKYDLHHDDDEKRQIELLACFDESQPDPGGKVTMQDSLPAHLLDKNRQYRPLQAFI